MTASEKTNASETQWLATRQAIAMFMVFALAYFLSTHIRAITATLSPQLTQEFDLSAGDLGLLSGAYFLGFALTQLPLGKWLDVHGPKKVLMSFLALSVLGCWAFSMAQGFASVWLARLLSGVGLSACLMAPLTAYRKWLPPDMQMRSNAWMLMTGSLGMLASTLPVQWLMPHTGWRMLFVGLGFLLGLSVLLILVWVPTDTNKMHVKNEQTVSVWASYEEVWKNPYFWKMMPLGFLSYGGMVAIQTLWAGPWLRQVSGWSPDQAAQGLFLINLMMLLAFWLWGLVMPRLTRRGIKTDTLIRLGHPLALLMLVFLVIQGAQLSSFTALVLGLYCVSSTFASFAQPAVGMSYAQHLAGRALSAYNLVIFAGIFAVQWGIGLLVDVFKSLGQTPSQAVTLAMAVYAACNGMAYLYFLYAKPK
jgi:predicted MFS family arabinose efflux permease